MEANTSSVATVASRPIGLSEALAAGAPLSWTETVAVIRDVAVHLHWSPTPLNVPTLSQISILPNGSVQIDGGRPNAAGPVAGLATLMEQLLDSTGCPQQLLDVQKQARANPPVYASPQALHAALEYFARPGSQDELAAYYKAAASALHLNAKNRELEALKEKTKASAETEKKPGQGKRSRVLLVPRPGGCRPDGDWRRALLDALRRPGAGGHEPVGRRAPSMRSPRRARTSPRPHRPWSRR